MEKKPDINISSDADRFDEKIRKVIPSYETLIEAIIDSIPFNPEDFLRALDLGIGTGAVTKKFLEKFINSRVTGIDMSLAMLGRSAQRLSEYKNRIKLYRQTVEELESDERFDCIYSNLTLHHLKTDDEKKACYSKIYDSLKQKGFFVFGDIVLGKDNDENSSFLDGWKSFLTGTFQSEPEAEWWIERHMEEDYPATINNHAAWLKEAGYKDVKVLWTNLNFAVISGSRL